MATRRMTPEVKERLARLHNMTPALIADELGVVRAKKKVLQDEEDLLKTVLDTKLKSDSSFDSSSDAIRGTKYILQVIKSSVHRFSQAKAQEILTPEQFESCFTDTEMTQYRTKIINPDEAGEQNGQDS